MHSIILVTSLVLATCASANPLVRVIQPCLECSGNEVPKVESQNDATHPLVTLDQGAETPYLDSDRGSKHSNTDSDTNTHSGTGIFDTEFQHRALEAHNIHRANHSANPLTWSTSLAQIAQEHANTCFFGHTRSGQNLGKGYPSHEFAIHNGWYNGEAEHFEPYYGMPSVPADVWDAVFPRIGHFTQVVWKDTKQVGCAVSACDGMITVCNYEPAGNVVGHFNKNVARPNGHAAFRAP